MSKALLWNSDVKTFRSFFEECFQVNGMNRLQILHVLNESPDFFSSLSKAYKYCKKNSGTYYSGVFSIQCEDGCTSGVLYTARLADQDDNSNPHVFVSFVALGSHFVASPKFHRLVRMNKPITKQVRNVMTDREVDVLRLVAKGNTTKEIASLLHISTHTVDTHKQKLYQKLNVQNTAELGKMAERYGMTDQEE